MVRQFIFRLPSKVGRGSAVTGYAGGRGWMGRGGHPGTSPPFRDFTSGTLSAKFSRWAVNRVEIIIKEIIALYKDFLSGLM